MTVPFIRYGQGLLDTFETVNAEGERVLIVASSIQYLRSSHGRAVLVFGPEQVIVLDATYEDIRDVLMDVSSPAEGST